MGTDNGKHAEALMSGDANSYRNRKSYVDLNRQTPSAHRLTHDVKAGGGALSVEGAVSRIRGKFRSCEIWRWSGRDNVNGSADGAASSFKNGVNYSSDSYRSSDCNAEC